MKIIRETIRRVGVIPSYNGVCDGCGTPVEYDEELIVIEVAVYDDVILLCPVDRLVCPECSKEFGLLRMYRSMEVTGEMAGLEKRE